MILIKRIFLLITIVFCFAILREFIELYNFAFSFHPIAGYLTLASISAALLYFVGFPLYQIIKLPHTPGPVYDKKDENKLIKVRLENYKKNDYLKEKGFTINEEQDRRKSYEDAVQILQIRCDEIRTEYITKVFYSTAIAQNGFIDVIFIFSLTVNLVKDIFILYNGRVSNRNLITIAKQVYISLAVGGSETTEYAVDEVASKLTGDALKSIPFVDTIITSLSDGLVNAVLITRISFITENYCIKLVIKDDRELSPTPKTILSTASAITSDLIARIKTTLSRISKEKTYEGAKYLVNPTKIVFEKTIDSINHNDNISDDEKDKLTGIIKNVNKWANPIGRGLESLLSRKRKV